MRKATSCAMRNSRRRSTNATTLAVCLLLLSCEVVFGGAEPNKNTHVYVNESAQHSACQNRKDAKTPELASIRTVLSTLISPVRSLLSAGGRTYTRFEGCYFAVSEYLLVDDSSFLSEDQFLSLLRRSYLQPVLDRQRKGIDALRTEIRGAVGSCNAGSASNSTCVCFMKTSACSITDSRPLNNNASTVTNNTVLPRFGWNSSAKLQVLLQEADAAFSTLQKPLPSAADIQRALLAANTLAGPLESLESSLTLIPCTRTSNASRCINAGRLRTAIAAVTKDHLVLNSSFLLAQLNSLKVIRSASRKFSTVFPFFWPDDDWKSFQRNISTALCNALFPACPPGRFASPLRTCYETCGALRKFEDVLNWPLLKGTAFSLSNSALILTLARSSCPRIVLQGELCVFASPSSHCYPCSVRRIVSVQTSNVSETKTDPLQIPCTAPLQKTSVREHYIPAFRDHIRSAAAKIFNATLNWTNDAIDSLFPCSIGCSTAGYSPKDASNIKKVAAVVSWLVLLASATACFFHFRNRSTESATVHRRLVLCLNLNCLVLAISVLPASFNWDNLYCHGDGTLRQNEASSDSMCLLLGTMAYAGMLTNGFLLACLSHQWLIVVRQLKKATVVRKDRKHQNKIFVSYLTVSLLPTVVLTTVMLALKEINGSPVTGTCAPGFTNLFALLTVPVSISILIAVVFLIVGLSLLFPAWKKATNIGRLLHLREHSQSSIGKPQTVRRSSAQSRKERMLECLGRSFSSLRSTSQSSEALRLLILRLFVYVAASMAMAAAHIAFGIIVYKDKDRWKEGKYESITCRLATARKLRHTCPEIPAVRADVLITLLVIFGAAGITLSSWIAFKQKGGSRKGSTRHASETSSNSHTTAVISNSLNSSSALSSITSLSLRYQDTTGN